VGVFGVGDLVCDLETGALRLSRLTDSSVIVPRPREIRNLHPLAGMRAELLPASMFIIPHGAPEGYEWFVALVVLVGLYFAVRNFMRAEALRTGTKPIRKRTQKPQQNGGVLRSTRNPWAPPRKHFTRKPWDNPWGDLPNPNPVRSGPGPEERLRNLQRRFRAVSERHDPGRYYRSAKIAALAAIVAFAVVWGLGSSPWPVMTTLRHIASAPNCGFARLVGLAPARRGEPGYWKRHDRDGDGIACEPWPPRVNNRS